MGTWTAFRGGHSAKADQSGAVAWPGARVPPALRVQVSSPSWPSGREYTYSWRYPVSSGAPTVIWTAMPPSSGRMSGASRLSSTSWPQPTWSPAWTASSTNAVPGSRAVPRTVWSASQGWVPSESLPVNSMPSPSARVTAALSSGCSAARRPMAVASPAQAADSFGQKRFRWKA